MPLSTQFTDVEVEYVREIAHLPNRSDAVAALVQKLDVLNSAQVVAVQRDIAKWEAIEYGTEKSKGGIKGTDYDVQRNRDQITDKMRSRLDYPALPSSTSNPDAFGYFALGTPSWMEGGDADEYSY
jgi:hypothetical protein